MRQVVAGLFFSLDGVVESPDKWQFAFDEDMGASLTEQIDSQDAILLGRTTYEEWVGYWPTVSGGENDSFARHINEKTKYVFSTRLKKTDWKNSVLVKGDLATEIGKLKRQPGKTIGVAGSPSLVRALIEADLLDELILLVHPVIAGSGKRLFKDGMPMKRLELNYGRTTQSGVAILSYKPYRAT